MLLTIGFILMLYIIGVVTSYNSHYEAIVDDANYVFITPVKRQATKKEAWDAVFWPWHICVYFFNKATIPVRSVVRFSHVLFEKG